MRKVLLVLLALAFATFGANALSVSSDGNDIIAVLFDTAGEDAVPTTGGSHDGWGEWFITAFHNDTGFDITLNEFGFPCCGPPTDPDYGWVVWEDVGGLNEPPGNPQSADYGGGFTPDDPSPDTFPPTDYTYVDISSEGVVIPNGNYFVIGYDVTGNGGQVDFNDWDTWAWYSGYWDPDQNWGRTAVMQVWAEYDDGQSIVEVSWGVIKEAF